MRVQNVIALAGVIAIIALALGATTVYRINSSVQEQLIVQPVETSVSQNVQCGINLGTVCSTESVVPCVYVGYGTTTKTLYIHDGSTFSASPNISASTHTITTSIYSTSTDTTEYCTHL